MKRSGTSSPDSAARFDSYRPEEQMNELRTPTPQPGPPTHPSQITYEQLRALRNLQLDQHPSPPGFGNGIGDELCLHGFVESTTTRNGYRITEKGKQFNTTGIVVEALHERQGLVTLSKPEAEILTSFRKNGKAPDGNTGPNLVALFPELFARKLLTLGTEAHSEVSITDYGREVEIKIRLSRSALRLLRNLQLNQWSPPNNSLEHELIVHCLVEPVVTPPVCPGESYTTPDDWIRLTDKGRDWDTTALRTEALDGKPPELALSNVNYLLVLHIRQTGIQTGALANCGAEAERLTDLSSGLVERHSDFGYVLTDYGREVELVDIEIGQPEKQPALGEPGFDDAVADQIDKLDAVMDKPSTQLTKALSDEIASMIGDDELTSERLVLIREFADAAAGLLNVRKPLGTLKKRAHWRSTRNAPTYTAIGAEGTSLGSLDTEGTEGTNLVWTAAASVPSGTYSATRSMSDAPATETFGAQVTRQGIGALGRLIDTAQSAVDQLTKSRTNPRIGELTKALLDAKQAGDQELVDRLRQRIDAVLVETPAADTHTSAQADDTSPAEPQ